MPTFGVPCPTTIVTIGLLLVLRPQATAIWVIPLVWTLIGGSAAWLLGMIANYGLIVAEVMFAACLWRRGRRRLRLSVEDQPGDGSIPG